MATHKVPQDVEADDKLLGPFNFRQFIYLLIVAALIALAWAVGQIFPFFAAIPVIPAIFLLILALPLRKDQPMETYIAALIQFYTKPNKRFWNPGQRESTITIIAPKVVEKQLTKNLSEEEAEHRLSFLANVVDSEGYSIKSGISATPQSGLSVPPTPSNPVRDELIAEASNAPDIFDTYESVKVDNSLETEADRRRKEIVEQMRASINAAHNLSSSAASPFGATPAPSAPTPAFNPSVLSSPTPSSPVVQPSIPMTAPIAEPVPPAPPKNLVDLSKNKDFTVATIAKEANRKPSRNASDSEVYISLH